MTPRLQPESKLPALVKLSSALAAEAITAREYNGAQHVAELEDSTKKPFYEATWADVEVGDIVLLPWESLNRILKVEIKLLQLVTEPGANGESLVIARYTAFGLEFGQAFDPADTVYVQSRL